MKLMGMKNTLVALLVVKRNKQGLSSIVANVWQLALVRLGKHYHFKPKNNTTKSKKQLINNQAKALMQVAVMRSAF